MSENSNAWTPKAALSRGPRSVSEARDELQRELSVRERCYPNWVREGRLCRTDADDRYARLATAVELLTRQCDLAEAQADQAEAS